MFSALILLAARVPVPVVSSNRLLDDPGLPSADLVGGEAADFGVNCCSSVVSTLSAVKANCTCGAEKFFAERLPFKFVLPMAAFRFAIEAAFWANCTFAEVTVTGLVSCGVVMVAPVSAPFPESTRLEA